MYQKLAISTVIFLFFFSKSFSQNELNLDLSNNCSYYGEVNTDKVYTFSSNQEAVNEIEKILQHVGLKKNFQINSANVPNAMAVIEGPTRYILYSQSFINQVNSATNSKWAAISILAHELGHHLNGHTLDKSGSRPPIELEADEFSGFVLFKMGATLADAQIAMNKLGSNTGTSTHPPKSARLEAIAVGWNRAKELSIPLNNNSTSTSTNNDIKKTGTPNTNPAPTIPSSPQTTVQYIAKCVFNGDPIQYYVTSTNVIVGLNPFTNQSLIIGQKQTSFDPRFSWFYVTARISYGVDANGIIWSQSPYGQPFQVGYVTTP
ncbi:MAG: M48 family metalloprotease [Candidatus Kapabacteria bacterium]|nr:M48 family metalloprotease [Candidatus Kapabacteria bacterium]